LGVEATVACALLDWRQAQLARFTPELRAQARALSEKRYRSGHAAIEAALASPHRAPGNADRNKYRHPLETLDFFGFRPSWNVLEYEPGGGWYTELLAPALERSGKLYVTSGDPNGPETERSTLYGQRLKLYLAAVPELFGKVETLVVHPAPAIPTLPLDGKLDLVLAIRELHNIVNAGQLATWLAAFHAALKTNAVLGIVEHRAQVGADPLVSSKKGYLPEAWVIAQIEAAGFRLTAKSEVNANPKDTKDYPDGVWTLPPTYRLGAKDHDKYAAIGESDRMTLRFVKVRQAKVKARTTTESKPPPS
jgi:predicted methyltransferase